MFSALESIRHIHWLLVGITDILQCKDALQLILQPVSGSVIAMVKGWSTLGNEYFKVQKT